MNALSRKLHDFIPELELMAATPHRRTVDNTDYQKRIQSSLSSIATLVTIVLQGGVAIWWAAGVSSELNFLRETTKNLSAEIVLNRRGISDEEVIYRRATEERILRIENAMLYKRDR